MDHVEKLGDFAGNKNGTRTLDTALFVNNTHTVDAPPDDAVLAIVLVFDD